MKIYTFIPTPVFAIFFLWAITDYFCQPDDPPSEPIKITVPALREET